MTIYEAEVAGVPALGRADIRIWSLYRDSIIPDVRCAVPAAEGDRVIVADLAERAHVNSWHVVAFVSEIGRLYPPATHEHSQGDVAGLSARLAAIEARLDALGG